MGRFILVSLGLLVVALSLTGAKRCRNNWLQKEGFCYKVFDEQRSWSDAEMFCRKSKPGCHLASIHSGEASHDLAEYISDYIKNTKPVWIGLSDLDHKGQWAWADRSRTNYVAWGADEPSDSEDQLCVQLKKNSEYYKWKTSDCEAMKPFLCQCP